MSFYLQMLREEDEFMGNTGFDDDMIGDPNGKDKYEVDIQDVADVIEDINADYVDQSSQDELDGQDLTEDPVNECMIAIYESEHNWNQIMQAIGSKEILEAAKGREMVMEAVDIKGWFTKMKQFFTKMWAKFTAIVKNWIDNAMAAFRTNKSFADKYGSKLADGKKAYEAAHGKSFKGYNFKSGNMGSFADKLAKVVTAAKSDANNNKTWADEIASKVSAGNFNYKTFNPGKKYEEAAANLRSALLSGKEAPLGTAASEGFRDALKESYFGSKEKVTLSGDSLDPAKILKVLRIGSDDVKDVKKAYNECKKAFNETIKSLNKLESAMSKGDASKEKSSAMTAVTKMVSVAKECKSALTMSQTMIMKAIHAQKSQARKVANAYIFALNKGTRKEKFEKADKIGESGGFFDSLELL